jgi:hypothetical protein
MFNSNAPTPDDLPTSAQLVRSTIVAVAAAAALLVTVVLPSEFGIDPTGAGSVLGLTEMGEIKTQLAEEAEADRRQTEGGETKATPVLPASQQDSFVIDRIFREFFVGTAMAQEMRKDEMSVTLKPGEATEIKLAMAAGAKVTYSWTANGGAVNFDMHGDSGGQSTSYEKGRGAPEANGVLEAAFEGNHGWFWRNRTDADVTVTLKTNGAYSDIKRLM